MQTIKVVYLLLHFPQLTETFVADEIQAISTYNIDIRIISLLPPSSGPVQPTSQLLLPYTTYAPGMASWDLWQAQFHYLFKSYRLYLHLFTTLLSEPNPTRSGLNLLKRVVVFLKATAIAHSLDGSGIDHLHVHFAWLSGAAGWICARLLGIPFTVTVHAYDIFSTKNDLVQLVCREADHIIAISDYNRTQIQLLGVCPPERISVIHCGVDLTKFGSPADKPRTHNSQEPLRILSVGSLVPKKGHSILIAACRQLDRQGFNFTCSIIGAGPDEQSLHHQILSYNLQEKIRLLGDLPHPEILAAYKQHDLFVLASRIAEDGDRDGIPVVLMEAGFTGLPLITTRVSGIPELVKHKLTGWLVPPDDIPALAGAISELSDDQDLQLRMKKNVDHLIRTQFNVQICAEELSILFRETSQSRQNSSVR